MVMRLITVLFSIYLLMWLQSFASTGVLEDDKQALVIYRNITIILTVCAALILPAAGWLADKAPSGMMIPLAFFIRGSISFSFQFIEDPRSPFAFCAILI